MNMMKDTSRVLGFCMVLVSASLMAACSTGASAAASSRAGLKRSISLSRPAELSRSIQLAQATCWDTMSCCIQRNPLTAAQSCGASAADIARVLNGAKVLHEATQAEAARLKEETQAQEDAKLAEAAEAEGEAAPEPPDCRGQNHHVISRPIAKALERHENLRGLYEPRDERLVAKAKDKQSHCGYQQWHRDVDAEVMRWIRRYEKATQEQFEAFLREIYRRPDMLKRFPNGF